MRERVKSFKQFLNESINDKLIPVDVNKFVYHKSAPSTKENREKISKEGLIPQGKSAAWLSDTKIDGAVIFATNSDNKTDWFESGYNDDVYEIDTSNLKNTWFLDPNFGVKNNQHVITFEPIPFSALKLKHIGTGKEYQ